MQKTNGLCLFHPPRILSLRWLINESNQLSTSDRANTVVATFHLLEHLEEFWGGTLSGTVLEMENWQDVSINSYRMDRMLVLVLTFFDTVLLGSLV